MISGRMASKQTAKCSTIFWRSITVKDCHRAAYKWMSFFTPRLTRRSSYSSVAEALIILPLIPAKAGIQKIRWVPTSVGTRGSSLQGASTSPARHGRGHGRGVARFDAHIDDGDLTRVHRGNRFLQNASEIACLGHRTESRGALRSTHGGQIDLRVRHALADPLVFDRAIAGARHPLLMQFVIVEGAVIGKNEQQRNLVMHRGPNCGDAHQEIAVAADRDRQASRAFQRQRGANGNAGAAADPAAAVRADIIERLAEREPAVVP